MTEPSCEGLTFEQALAELELVVRDLEDGQTGLEESLARYEAGIRLLKGCYQQLARAEQRILQLTGADEDGNPALVPFDHSATAENARPSGRRRRRADDAEPPV